MFESATNVDMDDLFLGTDFTPVISSTQEPIPSKKRHRDEAENEDLKIVEEKALNVNILPCSRAFDGQSPNVVKRKFPGPAGLLPDRSAVTNSVSEYKVNSTIPETDILFCSQRTVSTFEDGPWSQMTKDFFVTDQEALYEKFNISWIKNNSTVKKLLKAPFLAAIIQTIEVTQDGIPTVNVTLKDTTGDIQGTILHSLYEEKSDYFTSGSVIVLKQFGVLPGQNSFCLTITPDNLLTIYHSKLLKEQINDDTSKSSVIKILVQEFSIEDILKRYHEDLNIQSKSNTPNSTSLQTNLYLINRMPDVRNSICINSFKPPVIYNKSCSRSVRKSSGEIVNSIEKFNSQSSKKSEEFQSDFDGCFQKSMEFNCRQISIKGDKEHTEIWKNLFEDVDIDSLFDEF